MTTSQQPARSRGWIATLAAAAMLGALVVVPTAPASGVPPELAAGRLAYTDGADILASQALSIVDDSFNSLAPIGDPVLEQVGAGRHNGQASSSDDRAEGSYAFVSSRPTGDSDADDPDGEVYYLSTGAVRGSAEVVVQVTDDEAVQSSPAVRVQSKDCSDGGSRVQVAYASNESGNFDIFVATLVQDPDEPPSACEQLIVSDVVQLTTDPGDDLWPSWSPEGLLVFSSTRSDPLGDLYSIEPFPDGPAPVDTLVRLTDHPGEDVMPAVRGYLEQTQECADDVNGEPRWVAYRTTQFDPRGGLAILDLEDPGAGPIDLGVYQAAEPTWLQFSLNLAYTSYADDPAGDVEVGQFVRTCPDADLFVRMTAEPLDGVVDDLFELSVVAGNGGPLPAPAVVGIDLPEQFEVATLDPACSDIAACDLGVLTPDDTPVELTHVVRAVDDTGGSPIEVETTIETSPDGPADPNGFNNSSSVQLAVNPLALVAVQVAVSGPSPGNAQSGDTITATVTVSNEGPQDADVTLALDAALAAVGGATACLESCDLGTIAAGGDVQRQLTFDSTGFAGTFTVTADTTASRPGSDGDTAASGNGSIVVDPIPVVVAVAFTPPGPANIRIGTSATYTLVVTNTGTEPVTGASVAVSVPSGLPATITTCGSNQKSCTLPVGVLDGVRGESPTRTTRVTVAAQGSGTGPLTAVLNLPAQYENDEAAVTTASKQLTLADDFLIRADALTAFARVAAGRLLSAALPGVVLADPEPLAVPPPAKPPVDDSAAVEDAVVVFGTYGLAESHPTFSRGLFESPVNVASEVTATVGLPSAADDVLARLPGDVEGASVFADVADVVAEDGSDGGLLADLPIVERHPAYSPDGTRVAYARAVVCPPNDPECFDDGSAIVVADADGANAEVAFTDRDRGDVDTAPAWSPDGSQLAFTRVRRDDPPTIWVTNLADSASPVTTPQDARFVGDINEFDDEAAWSPDGTQIAFTRARCDTTNLAIEDDDASARGECGTPPDSGLPPDPDPTPEPIPIDDLPDPGRHDADIWVVDVGTGDESPLLEVEVASPPDPEFVSGTGVRCGEDETTVCLGGDDRGADWSPDGETIAYTHTGWLWLATAGGEDSGPVTGPRALTEEPFDAADEPLYPDDPLAVPPTEPDDPAEDYYPGLFRVQDPSWSPAGDRIAFAGQPRGQPDQRGIYWLRYVPDDPDAREVREIVQQPQPEIEPDWQPSIVADLAITMSADPAAVTTGDPSTITADVANLGPSTAENPVVEITVPAGLTVGVLPAACPSAGPPITCSFADLADTATASVDIPVTGATAGDATVVGEVSSDTADSDLTNNAASVTVTVVDPDVDVSVAIAADPNPAYVGVDENGDPAGDGHELTITARNDGTAPSSVTLAVAVPAAAGAPDDPCLTVAGCSLGVIPPAGEVVTTIQLDPEVAYAAAATAEVIGSANDPDLTNNVAAVDLEALEPRLLLLPDLGPPGFVTLAVGQDFPPGTEVDLDWAPGLEATANKRTADDDGTFSLAVVVLHRDRLGARGIGAKTTDLPFEVTTEFLVVPRSQAPPDFDGRG